MYADVSWSWHVERCNPVSNVLGVATSIAPIPLQELPFWLAALPHLTELKLNSNPLREPWASVARVRGEEHVLALINNVAPVLNLSGTLT